MYISPPMPPSSLESTSKRRFISYLRSFNNKMTATGVNALSNYLTEVSGYATLAPCIQHPFSNAFYFYANGNCQIKNAAAEYASCLCAKDADGLTSTMLSDVVTNSKCTNGEASTALSVYSNFCSSATALAESIATGVSSLPCKLRNCDYK